MSDRYDVKLVVGHVEIRISQKFEGIDDARAYGIKWLEEQRREVEHAVDAGDTEAAEYPTYFEIIDGNDGRKVYRSDRRENSDLCGHNQ
ncbi:hypothetical protein FE249_18920 (plasmid) [Acidiphilium multivorum]|uniref:hypothetical protein n=1 Tax=Acidiphilium multivorum TaxID=62140 RepID=UPI001F4C2450|nr:hypothetical protein [Acidiphilium multivorum]UNC16286.1 hypothetical protein FE249_18920 [Acidiphilium multivorum]